MHTDYQLVRNNSLYTPNKIYEIFLISGWSQEEKNKLHNSSKWKQCQLVMDWEIFYVSVLPEGLANKHPLKPSPIILKQ